MAPTVKLHYFNLRGRGEYVRWILAYCNVDYDDIRHTFEEWPEVKKSKSKSSILTTKNTLKLICFVNFPQNA